MDNTLGAGGMYDMVECLYTTCYLPTPLWLVYGPSNLALEVGAVTIDSGGARNDERGC
jgi:hypothetical protein